MFNFSLISLTSFILIYQNIILLNEETLILFCFIAFCWIIFTKLNKSIYNDLANRSLKTENSLTTSLNQLLEVLIYSIKLQNKFKSMSANFENLKIHFLKLAVIITDKLPAYSIYKSETIYPKKFKFTQNIEQQTVKLLALILSQKLNRIVSTQYFCRLNLKNPYFLCTYKINLREYFVQLKSR